MGETGFLIYQNKICDIWYQCCHLQGDEAPLGMLELARMSLALTQTRSNLNLRSCHRLT